MVLLDDLTLTESPRWHAGRLWFSDWLAGEVVSVDAAGRAEVVARVDGFPFCLTALPDGRMLVVAGREGRIYAVGQEGVLEPYADLRALADPPWNDVACDGRANVFVNNTGFDFSAAPFAPGSVAVVTADGGARTVAGDLAFPNGMAVTPDGATLIVAESYGRCLTAFDVQGDGSLTGRRVWADLGDGVPDGICLDADGAAWYADVPNRRCVRVAEGGEVLDTIEADRGCFSCCLGGDDGRTLFIAAADWRGPESVAAGERTGQILAVRVAVPAA